MKATIYTPNEIQIDTIQFETAESLNTAFQRAERVIAFENPDGSDTPFYVLLRAPTPHEVAMLYQTTMKDIDTEELISLVIEKSKTDESIESDEITRLVTKAVAEQDWEKTEAERFWKRLELCIVKPEGVTRKWLQARNPNFLEILDDTIEELITENAHWEVEYPADEKRS